MSHQNTIPILNYQEDNYEFMYMLSTFSADARVCSKQLQADHFVSIFDYKEKINMVQLCDKVEGLLSLQEFSKQ